VIESVLGKLDPIPPLHKFLRAMLLEAISKIGFWFKFSRRNSAGQERGAEFQPEGILNYVEDLKREPNAGTGSKDILEIASSPSTRVKVECFQQN